VRSGVDSPEVLHGGIEALDRLEKWISAVFVEG
jgi:hypothetical protein